MPLRQYVGAAFKGALVLRFEILTISFKYLSEE
jgi:hypothetical protein